MGYMEKWTKTWLAIAAGFIITILAITGVGCAMAQDVVDETTLTETTTVELAEAYVEATVSYVNGIDISQHQGSINAKAIDASVVVVRLGVSGYGAAGKIALDEQFMANMNKLANVDCEIALYWASHSVTSLEVARENEFIVDTLGQLSPELVEKIDYLFIDREQSGTGKGRADDISREQFNAVLSAQVNSLQKMLPEINVGVYTNVDYLVNMVDIDELGNVPYWVAWYVSEVPASFEAVVSKVADKSVETAEWLEQNIVMWQYSETGNANGIDETVDLNLVSSMMLD